MLNWLFTKTPLLYLVQPFWRDEAFSYFMAKKSIIEIAFLTAKDFNPPLYYFLLHFWMKIFGSSEIALRSLSIMFFWANISIIFLFLIEIFKMKERKATFYLLIFIVNPILLFYAFEARMYSMLAFLATLSFYAFFKKNERLYLFAMIAGLFTHYFMVLIAFSHLLILKMSKNKSENIKVKNIYISLLTFLPWVIFFVIQNGLSSNFWIQKPNFSSIFGLLGIIYSGNESSFYPTATNQTIEINLIYLSIILMFIVLIGVFLYAKRSNRVSQTIFETLAFWGIGIPLFVWLFSFIKPIYFPRYLIFASVGLLFLIIFILEKLNNKLQIIFMVALIILSINYQKLQISYRKKADIINVLKEIDMLAGKKDRVYAEELDYFTVQYYLKNKKVYIYDKNYKDISTFNGKALINKDQVALNLPTYPQKAFIYRDGSYTISALY